ALKVVTQKEGFAGDIRSHSSGLCVCSWIYSAESGGSIKLMCVCGDVHEIAT
ncbi:15141_t:CDS:1, partial [Acaulospora morrowiae]